MTLWLPLKLKKGINCDYSWAKSEVSITVGMPAFEYLSLFQVGAKM